jgi:hypothetical protein
MPLIEKEPLKNNGTISKKGQPENAPMKTPGNFYAPWRRFHKPPPLCFYP